MLGKGSINFRCDEIEIVIQKLDNSYCWALSFAVCPLICFSNVKKMSENHCREVWQLSKYYSNRFSNQGLF